jgi:hypothetical protein
MCLLFILCADARTCNKHYFVAVPNVVLVINISGGHVGGVHMVRGDSPDQEGRGRK